LINFSYPHIVSVFTFLLSSPIHHCLHTVLNCYCTVSQCIIEFIHITCIFLGSPLRTAVSLMTDSVSYCSLSVLYYLYFPTTRILQDARKASTHIHNPNESWACTLRSWSWKQHCPSKFQYSSTWLHGVCHIPGDCSLFWITVVTDWMLFRGYIISAGTCVFKITEPIKISSFQWSSL
jgi:hypothetical protein